jgi:hypothetical protein
VRQLPCADFEGFEMIRTSILSLFLLVAAPANADIDIYKCVDAQGNVAYQQTPCPVVKGKIEVLEEAVKDEVAETPQVPVVSNQTHEEVETCKKPLRDAIDAIEAEMLRGYSPEQGEEFKVKLRTLTQEMRACG